MRVVVAPTAFKGTLSAIAAADAIAAGVSEGLPDVDVIVHPVADGGDGTLEVVRRALGGQVVPATVSGPMGSPVEAPVLFLEGQIALIEMARASGITMVEPSERDVMVATTAGTGQLISSALDHGPDRLIVGLGGSATVDAGLGMMRALGVGFFARNGTPISSARDLAFLERIDLTFRDKRLLDVDVVAACDVVNPLLGPDGAVPTFAPQKGATPSQMAELEMGVARFTEVVMRTTGKWVGETPRGGAAGGAGAALYALAGAELAPGFDVVADLTGFNEVIDGADVLIVGEGAIDTQTLKGKAVASAARRAYARGVEIWALAGRIELGPDQLRGLGVTRWRQPAPGGDAAIALREAARELTAST